MCREIAWKKVHTIHRPFCGKRIRVASEPAHIEMPGCLNLLRFHPVPSPRFVKPENICVFKPSLFTQMLHILLQVILHYPFIPRIFALHSADLR